MSGPDTGIHLSCHLPEIHDVPPFVCLDLELLLGSTNETRTEVQWWNDKGWMVEEYPYDRLVEKS